MRIDDDTDIDVERVAEDDVGSFTSDPGKGGKLVHCLWNFAAVFFDQNAAGGLDVFGFGSVESDAFDVLFEFGKRSVGEVLGGLVFLEKIFGNDVDLFIGALRG